MILRQELNNKIAEIKLCNESKLNMCHEIDTLKAQVSTLREDSEISSEIKIEPPFSDKNIDPLIIDNFDDHAVDIKNEPIMEEAENNDLIQGLVSNPHESTMNIIEDILNPSASN